jgi:hypothetical protein
MQQRRSIDKKATGRLSPNSRCLDRPRTEAVMYAGMRGSEIASSPSTGSGLT